MKKRNFVFMMLLIAAFAASPAAYAKKDGNPAGWSKGEKKGWNGGEVPPGLSKKDQKAAEKAAKKAKEDAEKKMKEAKAKAKAKGKKS